MGKWLARLEALTAEKSSAPPSATDCQSCQKPLLSVLSGQAEGGNEEIELAPPLPPSALRLKRRMETLQRWGWSAPDARALVDRLALRNPETDDRITCAGDCAHFHAGRCSNHKRAGMGSPLVGRALASLLQRCPGFRAEEV